MEPFLPTRVSPVTTPLAPTPSLSEHKASTPLLPPMPPTPPNTNSRGLAQPTSPLIQLRPVRPTQDKCDNTPPHLRKNLAGRLTQVTVVMPQASRPAPTGADLEKDGTTNTKITPLFQRSRPGVIITTVTKEPPSPLCPRIERFHGWVNGK